MARYSPSYHTSFISVGFRRSYRRACHGYGRAYNMSNLSLTPYRTSDDEVWTCEPTIAYYQWRIFNTVQYRFFAFLASYTISAHRKTNGHGVRSVLIL
jgi:hypothetical protein